MATMQKSVVVPHTIEQAAKDQKRIGELLREIQEHETTLARSIQVLEEASGKRVRTLQEEIHRLARGIHSFAEEHRNDLTEHGRRKTVSLLRSGTVLWYSTPASVAVRSVQQALAYLKKRRLRRFIRVKEEVDKDALRKEPAVAQTIPGVSLSSGNKFAIRPRGAKERVECNLETKRWKIATPAS